jgi:hypothetical protein
VLVFFFPDLHSVKVFSYSELRKATQDFSGANKIGEGGFGSVFRVNMRENFSSTPSVYCADGMGGEGRGERKSLAYILVLPKTGSA